jgi:cytochrome P450
LGVTGGPLRAIMDSWMMALDGPAHTRTRALVSRAFTPRAVEAMRPTIAGLADGLVGTLIERGGGDIVEALAFPLPMDVTRIMFGVDAPTWDREIVGLFDPARRDEGAGFVPAMAKLAEFLEAFVPQESGGVETDLFAALSGPDDSGNRMSDLERVANAVLLVTAGFETTMSLITLAVWTLLSHPDQLRRLRDDWSLARNAVEEVLRYEPAALWTSRFATEDIEVAGAVIPQGSNVLFSSVAANRDPARFQDPDRFDIDRSDIRPVTFGGGVHSCLGAALARLEAEIAVTTLFRRAPKIALLTKEVVWQDGNPSVRRPTVVEVAV